MNYLLISIKFNIVKRRVLLVLIFAILSSTAYSQVDNTNNEQKFLSEYCKIWGFVKYNYIYKHSKYDWDEYCLNSIREITKNPSLSTFNNTVANSLDVVKLNNESTINKKTNIDTLLFNDNNKNLLSKILKTETVKNKKYMADNFFSQNRVPKFRNEKSYTKGEILLPEYRLLALFRFWNVINYYYPTLDNTYNWDQVLYNYIPKFIEADTKVKYHYLMLEFNALLRDSHSTYIRSCVLHKYNKEIYPIEFDYTDDITTISYIYYGSKQYISDTVIRLNNKSITYVRDSLHKYISASTKGYLETTTNGFMKMGYRDTLFVTLKNGKTISIPSITTINRERYFKEWMKRHRTDSVVKVGSVVYFSRIDAFKSKKEVKKMLSSSEVSTIIIDLRKVDSDIKKANYIIKFLSKKYCIPNSPTMILTFPDWKNPGNFVPKTYKTDKDCKNKTDKKIILIIDENTQSHMETFVMNLQQSTVTSTIGSISSGANGVITDIEMPDGIRITFTSLGVYFPSGECLQRRGIIPDTFMTEKEIEDFIYGKLNAQN